MFRNTTRLLAAAVLFSACAEPTEEALPEDPSYGTLQAAITADDQRDVALVRFKVFIGQDDIIDCANIPAGVEQIDADRDVPLVGDLPDFLEGGEGEQWYGSDEFVLEPGPYTVCAYPLAEGGGDSAECFPAPPISADVAAATPARAISVIPCEGDVNGSLTAIASLNNAPTVDGLDSTNSNIITLCPGDETSFTASATDPNGDAIAAYSWTLVDSPADADIDPTREESGNANETLRFSPVEDGEGDGYGIYLLSVVATDGEGVRSQPLLFEVIVDTCDFDGKDELCAEQCEGVEEAGCGPDAGCIARCENTWAPSTVDCRILLALDGQCLEAGASPFVQSDHPECDDL